MQVRASSTGGTVLCCACACACIWYNVCYEHVQACASLFVCACNPFKGGELQGWVHMCHRRKSCGLQGEARKKGNAGALRAQLACARAVRVWVQAVNALRQGCGKMACWRTLWCVIWGCAASARILAKHMAFAAAAFSAADLPRPSQEPHAIPCYPLRVCRSP